MQHGVFGSVDLLEATLKTLLYLGLLLALGSGLVSRLVGPELLPGQGRVLGALLWIGTGLMLLASLGKGWVEAAGLQVAASTYFLETFQGNVMLLRLVLLVGLLLLGLRTGRWLYGLVGLGLLLTISLISHAGASRSGLLLADWVHLGAVAVWAGSIMALAWCWEGNAREVQLLVVQRLSRLGWIAVGLLVLAGGVLALVQVGSPGNLNSAYGFSLFRKLFFVLPVLLVAGLNRFVILPRLVLGGPTRTMGHMLFLESWLLLLVLVFSGLLSSTPPPGSTSAGFEPNPSDVNIEETLGKQKAAGRIYTQTGLTYISLNLTDLNGEVLPQGPSIALTATNSEGKTIRTKDFPTAGARYFKALPLERGDWTIVIEWTGEGLGQPERSAVRLEQPERSSVRLEYSLGVP